MFEGHGIVNFIELIPKNLVEYVSTKEPKTSLYEYIKDGNKHLYKNFKVTHFSKFDSNLSEFENNEKLKKEVETIMFTHFYSKGYDAKYIDNNFEIKIVTGLSRNNFKEEALSILQNFRQTSGYIKDESILDSVKRKVENDIFSYNIHMELVREFGHDIWKICFPKIDNQLQKLSLNFGEIDFDLNEGMYYDFDAKDKWAFNNSVEYYKKNKYYQNLTKDEQINFDKYEILLPYIGNDVTIERTPPQKFLQKN